MEEDENVESQIGKPNVGRDEKYTGIKGKKVTVISPQVQDSVDFLGVLNEKGEEEEARRKE